ncbi:hypothetical protein [Bacillus arachidis]|uniref:hypothetical protein n=1 Tax=Bacillus arachidis TaxID=2819290 RepID=UPI00255CC6B7|nr:hypothetical protein [Bacillus arachidis]WIY59004.1 hypothetical protein QRY57_01170 [Bacillus arachidis]
MKQGNDIDQMRTLQRNIPGPKSIFSWRMNMKPNRQLKQTSVRGTINQLITF